MAWINRGFDSRQFHNVMKIKPADLIFEFVVYIICIFLIVLFWQNSFVLFVGILAVSAIIFIKWHEKKDFIYYFVAFFLGTIAEIIAVYSGAWQYTKPFYLIPVWLSFLWGIAGLLLLKIGKTLSGE